MRFEIGRFYLGSGPEIYEDKIFLVLELGDPGWVRCKSWDADFLGAKAHYGLGREEWLNTNYFRSIEEIKDINRQYPGFPG
jgi:hypothetical protein